MSEEIANWVKDIYNNNYFAYDSVGYSMIDGFYNEEINNIKKFGDTDFEKELKISDNKSLFIINYSLDIAEFNLVELLDAVKENSKIEDVPESAVIIAAAALMYKKIHKELIKEKVDYYADDYNQNISIYNESLEDNNLSFQTCVNRVAEVYYKNNNSKKM